MFKFIANYKRARQQRLGQSEEENKKRDFDLALTILLTALFMLIYNHFA